jgi:nanoRNase/pAp phosphatase (c-di-AMP/oligoRNAs hydrolase)
MKKTRIPSLRARARIADALIDVMIDRQSFLMVGHRNPDEDCVASMVAFGLLMVKFGKPPAIVFAKENHERFPYLLSICKYNSIRVVGMPEELESEYDTIVSVDTPKPEMLEFRKALKPIMDDENVLVAEVDHHLEADGFYIGDEGYRLVDEASSTCELIGYLALRLSKKKRVLREYLWGEVFTRNFVLSIVTGIVGDSKMGQFLKSRREKRYYRYFSRLFNKMLIEKTDKDSGNFSSIEDILNELEKLSVEEENCSKEFLAAGKTKGRIAYIALDQEKTKALMDAYDLEVVVTVAKYVANRLAEESGYVSLVAYYDHPKKSDYIQLRMRRSQSFKEVDLREAIDHIGIKNGGGHAGAVGFRVPKSDVTDYDSFIMSIVDEVEAMIE